MYQRIYELLARKRKKQICITTYFDDAFYSVGILCYQAIRQYAERHHMDAVLLNSVDSNRPAPWNKILVVKELFSRGFEFVLWVDADAIIVDYSRNIADIIERNKYLYLVKHTIDSQEVPNTGMFLIKNNEWSHALLDMIWEKQAYVHHKWWENAAFIDLLGYHHLLDKNKSNVLNLNLLEKIKWLDVDWNSLPGICESDRPVIQHYAARSLEYRLEHMTRDLDEHSQRR